MKPLFPTLAALSVLMTPALAMGQGATEVDANGDGVLSLEEVQAVYPETTAEDFDAMDLNGDGALDDAEVQAAQDAGLMAAPSAD
ncbi:hypothetical protein [Aquicoccus porphyridii]|nr:hypothetical protein [Aquicoccus porphyridii]